MKKRFKVGDKVRVVDHEGFSAKGKTLIGKHGTVVSNSGNGHYDVALQGMEHPAYLPASALEVDKGGT